MSSTSGTGRPPTRGRAVFAALLLVSLGLNLAGVGWGLGGAWTWAPDEIRPGQVLAPVAWSDKYPPLHRYVLGLVVEPVNALLDRAAAMPWQSKLAWLVTVQRLVSVLAALGVVVLVARTAREILGERAKLAAAVVVVLSPPFVFYAKTANLEMAYLFWFAASLWFFVRAWREGKARDFVGASLTAVAAVTTKDQAYGLYPVLMAASLVRIASDHSSAPDWRRRCGRTLRDRRLWASLLAATVLLVAVYAPSGGWSGFVEHFDKIVGQNTMKYQVYERSLTGFAQLGASALLSSAFVTGWPVLLLALLGAGLAIADRRKSPLGLILTLVPIGYVLSFVAVIGFDFARFYLPLLPVFAILAARGWLQVSEKWPRFASAGAIAVIAYGLVRCLAVDAAMLTDTRLEARAHLEAHPTAERAVGIGRVQVLPHGLETVLWGQIRPSDCEFLDRDRPDRIVLNANDLRTERERAVVRGFDSGQLNYELERRFLPRFEPPGWGSPMTNMSYISPEVLVYRRVERPCLDKDSLVEVLNRPESRGNDALERALIALLLREGWGTVVDAEGRAAVFNTTFGSWTRATQPAVLALENPGLEPLQVELRLAVAASAEDRPIPIRIREPGAEHQLLFSKETRRDLRLADLAPGETRLVWIWSEKAWPGRETPPRMLGVMLAGVTLAATEPPA